jgi:uncharacterized membrane protein (UPF0127 family)
MAGQAVVVIGDREWSVDLATFSWELSQGLGGLSELPASTGMLFDLGWEQIIEVTSVPMLFPLDIAFMAEDLSVTELYKNVVPGYIVTSQSPARYFIEVNAGELDDIETGDQAEVSLLSVVSVATEMDWMPAMLGFMGFMLMGMLMVTLVRALTSEAFKEPEKKPLLYSPRGERFLAHTTEAIQREETACGTCYADAWRFLIKHGEGELVHGTVYSGNRRIGHAWVQTNPDFIWEPQTSRYFTNLGFRSDFAPIEESRYSPEQAAVMLAQARHFGPWTQEERRQYLEDNVPALIHKHKSGSKHNDDLELLPDSPEFLAYTIDDIGFRDIIDSAFREAITRARGLQRWQ